MFSTNEMVGNSWSGTLENDEVGWLWLVSLICSARCLQVVQNQTLKTKQKHVSMLKKEFFKEGFHRNVTDLRAQWQQCSCQRRKDVPHVTIRVQHDTYTRSHHNLETKARTLGSPGEEERHADSNRLRHKAHDESHCESLGSSAH